MWCTGLITGHAVSRSPSQTSCALQLPITTQSRLLNYSQRTSRQSLRHYQPLTRRNQYFGITRTIKASSSSGDESRSTSRPGEFPSGTVLASRYEVQRVIGTGGNGITYRCYDRTSNQDVAVKALSLRALKDWKQLELFEREATVLENLKHPSIPHYIDYFEQESESDKAFFLVQELADGKSLQDLMNSGWRPDESEITRIAGELLKVLNYLGSLRPPVVHRDIKPANIVLQGGTAGGKVYLVDFGGVQAAAAAAADTLGSTVVGSYGFMAPEQFRGSALPSSDLYGLGGTLLYLVSGRPPSSFPVDRLRFDLSGVTMSSMLRALCEGLLEPAVEDRLSVVEAQSVLSGQQQQRRARDQPPASRGGRNVIGGSAFRTSNTRGGQQGGVVGDRGYDSGFEMVPQERFSMPPSGAGTVPIPKPVGSRIRVRKQGPRLEIDIPPSKFNASSAYTGGFAIAWNAFVAFWTVGALTGGGILFALFSLPFWFAGANLLKQAFGRQLVRERLEISLKSWKLMRELALLKDGAAEWPEGPDAQGAQKAGGRSADLAGAGLQIVAYVNGQPQGQLVLKQGVESYAFGEGLDPMEQEWLADVINRHLDENSEVMKEISAAAGGDIALLEDGTSSSSSSSTKEGAGEGYDDFTQREFKMFDAKLGAEAVAKARQAGERAAAEGARAGQRAQEEAAAAARRAAAEAERATRPYSPRRSSSRSNSTIDIDDFEVLSDD